MDESSNRRGALTRISDFVKTLRAKSLQDAALRGNPIAQFRLACAYAQGAGVPKDNIEALIWISSSLSSPRPLPAPLFDEAKSTLAHIETAVVTEADGQRLCDIAQRYLGDPRLARSTEEAGRWYRHSAEKGFAPAQYHLGTALLDAVGKVADKDEALVWLRRAAAQQHAPARASLGRVAYRAGVDLKSSDDDNDDRQAGEWFLEAADCGHTEAQYELGKRAVKGGNDAAAAQWFEKAANQGHPAAQFEIGALVFAGKGVSPDIAAAAEWFSKAADQGHAHAALRLGELCVRGEGVPTDEIKALRLFEMAAQDGVTAAVFHLGVAHALGRGTKRDVAAATQLFSRAYRAIDKDRDGMTETTPTAQRCEDEVMAAGEGDVLFELGLMCENSGLGAVDGNRAVRWYSSAAGRQHADAQYRLATLSLKGSGPAVDEAKAAHLLKMSADQGYIPARERYANLMYQKSRALARRRCAAEAIQSLSEAAVYGHTIAQFNLAQCYDKGIVTRRDPAAAMRWYETAAQSGHGNAQCELAALYDQAAGARDDMTPVVHWYTKAANNGVTAAMLRLADLLRKGERISADPSQANVWYRKAAELGNPIAALRLGLAYASGHGIQKDSATALLQLKSAYGALQTTETSPETDRAVAEIEEQLSQHGDPDLLYKVAGLFEESDEDCTEHGKVLRWLLISANKGHPEALFQVAQAYASGTGLPCEPEKAFDLFRSAAKQHHVEAQRVYAPLAYERGTACRGGSRQKALAWFEEAADCGHLEAQLALATAYGSGDGVGADAARAAYWYEKAAAQGHMHAQWITGVSYDNGNGVPKDDAKAALWYRAAAEQGHPGAQNNLGNLLKQGHGVPADATEAFHWHQKSAMQGDNCGQFNLANEYAYGIGTTRNPILGYAWMQIACMSRDSKSDWQHKRDEIGLLLSDAQWKSARSSAATLWETLRPPEDTRAINAVNVPVRLIDGLFFPPPPANHAGTVEYYRQYSGAMRGLLELDIYPERLIAIRNMVPSIEFIGVKGGVVSWLGYHAFAFEEKGLAILECPVEGNATYILRLSDWKKALRFSKAHTRIHFPYARYFHTSPAWKQNVHNTLEKGSRGLSA